MKRSVEPFEEFLKTGKLERKEYQIDGVKWMLEREEDESIKGGILADEMGLGKTIQVLGTILCNCKLRTLIVLPVTLLEQWYKTIYYFTGHKAVLFHGVNRPKDISNSPIVLTTYHLIRCPEIQNLTWDRIVYDEAHHLRNPKAKTNEYVSTLKKEITWLITGTPIQNKTRDIVTLFEVLGIDYKKEKDVELLCMKYLLKRRKDEVNITLPDIKYHDITVEWNEADKKAGVAFALHNQLAFNDPIITKDNSFNRWACSLSDKCKLPLYTKTKQLCVMPYMLKVTSDNIANDDVFEIEASLQNTDKLDKMIDHLIESPDTVKKMVFCNFRKEMDYIKFRLWLVNREAAIIDGRTSYSKKSKIFSNLPEILILQVYTCCEGLNLQEYRHIYFSSPQWNPSIEDQAIARCYRVGQTKSVEIFHFTMSSISENTKSLENYVCKIQADKRKLYI